MEVVNDKLVIFDTNNTGKIWSSDGTPEGTQVLHDFASTDWRTYDRRVYCGNLYFAVSNQTTNGTVIWKTDGTAAGTLLQADPYFEIYQGSLYFIGTDAAHGAELWTYGLPGYPLFRPFVQRY